MVRDYPGDYRRRVYTWRRTFIESRTSCQCAPAVEQHGRGPDSATCGVSLEPEFWGALAIDPNRLIAALGILHKGEMVPLPVAQVAW